MAAKAKTMAPEKSRSLHNFSLPPRLNWGTQKLLRCAKLNHHSGDDAVSVSDRKRRYPSNASFRPKTASIRRELISGDGQIEAIREKLIIDLRCEVDKMRAAFLGNSHIAPSSPPPPPPPAETRPWNLRDRRAACKEPLVESKSGSEQTAAMKAPPPARADAGAGEGGRAKFSVALSKQEIEDDFVKMMGRRPPRKPKKRPRYVQRQLDTLFPGLWLSEITADMYKVNENPESAK
uniref:DUF1639 family protein n=1 Tax=Opuntia streptacantha TaxID=393608 RepID=A0A7C9DN95_OPUST